MAWNEKLSELVKVLAELYPDKAESRVIVEMSGIPPGNISFKDAANQNWFFILKEATNRNKVESLVQMVLLEYPREDLENHLEGLKEMYANETQKKPMQSVEKMHVNNLKTLLQEGDYNSVLEELKKLGEEISTEFYNSVTLASARIRRLEKDISGGTVTDDNKRVQFNLIFNTLISIIDDIPEEQKLNASRNMLNTKSSGLAIPSIEDFEKVIGRQELFDTNWLQKAINASKSVCKVLTSSGESGTGFILNGGYLLTNYHVFSMDEVSNDEMAKRIQKAKAIFNFKVDENGNMEAIEEYTFDTSDFTCNTLNNLDYVLVKVNDSKGTLSNWGQLELDNFSDPVVDDKVNIIQHPDGKSMKIALPDKIISVWDKYLFYVADTKGGSSGSPVFNQNWKVIALHHAGINEEDWAGGMRINSDGKIAPSNRGILIKEIIQHVKDNSSIEI